ncbi:MULTISPECIES: nuclear transport factor 2 family protein [Maritimibacter]|uniref:SnoaL-like domain-containing protein n=1 Tax=Maritimibacter alkaliphilus HTCC2654 TaxID=314271 RepID=A3VAI0_9RHOB|nr:MULTISPECIES: nuclear transport factor 2 family protein [Maritimibacter]EAQ14921.1 hypothetical protein RB2654_20098 [Maritimibacter alkaliphilus HTCC2654]MBL6426594.1 nuclear transport factor 2 family protein [Maritimibacter sp.]TYP80852.1 SnoaL-like protein [Maritimibacter alkaliphilus HTCC2654]
MTEDDILAIDDIMFTAVNYRDWENVLRYIGHDTLIQIGPLGELRGKTGADAVIAYFDKHYDYRFLSWQHVVEGNESSTLAVARLTYLETIHGLPEATGQVAEVPVAVFGTWDNGKLTRLRFIISFVDFMSAV